MTTIGEPVPEPPPFGNDRVLTRWDTALLDHHREFYLALASGKRQPTTALQAHFVAVIHSYSQPVTQHEIAFQRFREGWRDPRREAPVPRPDLAPAAVLVVPERIERSVDLADAAQLETLMLQAGYTFRQVRRLYVVGTATASRTSADAAVWISTALADAGIATPLERWTSATFGSLSNVYTKAVDGDFVNGLRPGADYVSPWLHRLFDGHTPGAAWQAVRNALPDDTLADELVGWLQALGSDFATVVGLPVTSLTPEDFARLEAVVCGNLGVSQDWLIDALHMNAVEGLQLAAGCVPILAATMGWSAPDAKAFARLAGSLGVGAVVAANPIMTLAALAMLGKAYQLAKEDGTKGLWREAVEGSATSGAALGTAALVGGPALCGVFAGVIVAAGLKGALKPRPGFSSGWMEKPAARIAAVISRLQDGPERLRMRMAF